MRKLIAAGLAAVLSQILTAADAPAPEKTSPENAAAESVKAETAKAALALRKITEGAQKGDPMMMAAYSEILRRGAMGTEKDYDAALDYATKAADAGNPVGMYNLAVIYDSGFNVSQDSEKAAGLYKKAFPGLKKLADEGNPWAQYDLGYMFLHGKTMPENKAEAMKLLTKSAEGGHSGAQYALGYIYHRGESVPKNEEAAFKWYYEAAKQNEPQAQYMAALYFIKNKPQIKSVCPDAKIWMERAAEQGEPNAQHALGLMYETGNGAKKDTAEAVTWYSRAAAQGHSASMAKMIEISAKAEKALKNNSVSVKPEAAPAPQAGGQEKK
jgi:TPR repeat protein